MVVEGEFVGTVIGTPGCRSNIITLRLPDGGTGIELSLFVRPDHERSLSGSADAVVENRIARAGRRGRRCKAAAVTAVPIAVGDDRWAQESTIRIERLRTPSPKVSTWLAGGPAERDRG